MSLQATEVSITGRAADYSGETLVFYSYSNMISFTQEEEGSCMVGDSGVFSCSMDLEATRLVYTSLGVYSCFFYAEPGMIYKVSLPPRRDKTMSEKANPYFEDISIHLSAVITGSLDDRPVPESEEELNFLIRTFNDSFYPYYYKYVVDAYANNMDRKEIGNTIESLEAMFDSINNTYFNAYMKSRFGLLNYYGGQMSTRKIIEEYLLDAEVSYYNPAYMELFNELFRDYFDDYAMEHPDRQLPVLLNRDMDYTLIQTLFKKEGLENDTVREMVILKGLYDGFYKENNNRSSMVQLLDSVRIRSTISFIRETVNDITGEFTRMLPGYKPPDFALYDSDSNLVRLSDFAGDYVYLNFCNSFSSYCIREYEYLSILQQRTEGKGLSIITILVDDNFPMMQDLVRNNDYHWTFLHFSNQPEMLDDYNITGYPAYFLIGPGGEMLLSPAPSPAENFESTFFRISTEPY